ncbi:hypothetical protein F4821DRAFT_250614 [Hypoxylon rubiginosum]|uniref:Uncharacterized protein n=1 Tax=Hypoxylon rubiginosum TaxID=110542 RepID=A0ACC0CKG8_9PEZI|nr:hypothetical protein F4821DRAFT_250614 [Hypoxylon rubiginosum]
MSSMPTRMNAKSSRCMTNSKPPRTPSVWMCGVMLPGRSRVPAKAPPKKVVQASTSSTIGNLLDQISKPKEMPKWKILLSTRSLTICRARTQVFLDTTHPDRVVVAVTRDLLTSGPHLRVETRVYAGESMCALVANQTPDSLHTSHGDDSNCHPTGSGPCNPQETRSVLGGRPT